jgi:nitrile hydratase
LYTVTYCGDILSPPVEVHDIANPREDVNPVEFGHDLGGMREFGPVPDVDDDLDFHAAWETRVYGLMRTLLRNGAFTDDEFRYAVEQMDPAAYLSASYFERWVDTLERLSVSKGFISQADRAELLAMMSEPQV